MVRILVIDNVDTDLEEYKSLAKDYDLVHYKLESREKFAADLKSHLSDISAIWCLWVGFYAIGGLNQELLPLLPESLKVITIASVGYDQYDAQGLRERGITLCNTPDVSSTAVADLAAHLVLSCYRYTSVFEHALRNSGGNTTQARRDVVKFDQETGQPEYKTDYNKFAWGEQVGSRYVQSPSGHRVGIAGFGRIGQLSGKRLAGLGMEVHYTKRNQLSDEEYNKLGYEAVYHESINDLFAHSDLLLLALPMTPETKHLVNEDSIKLLPDGARIVNVGRGGLIDQRALVQGLKSGKLSAAGLDVFEKEPIVEKELLERYDVTLLPHLGGATIDTYIGSQINGIKNVRAFLETGKGLHPVN